jgi:hypothetical protein
MQALMAGMHYSSINAVTGLAGRSQSFRQQTTSSSAASQRLNGNPQLSCLSLSPTPPRSCSVLTRIANTLSLAETERVLYATVITVHRSGKMVVT